MSMREYNRWDRDMEEATEMKGAVNVRGTSANYGGKYGIDTHSSTNNINDITINININITPTENVTPEQLETLRQTLEVIKQTMPRKRDVEGITPKRRGIFGR